MTTPNTPQDVLPTYERMAQDYFEQRNRALFEKPILDRMLGIIPANQSPRRLLDLGCGTGAPIASYLSERGLDVTGVDGAEAMTKIFAQTLPSADVHHADMRTLNLQQTFDGILAWDSFFHLSPDDQRAMFAVFARHAAPNAALMFTSGPNACEAFGHAAGAPIYHASLDPDDYRANLHEHGFKVLDYRPEDPTCDRHTIWLARFTA